MIDSADAPEFFRRSIDAIADCPDVFGVTWWCSHRIPSTFSDFPFFEHQLGLFDVDGTLTDVGKAFRDAIATHRDTVAPPRTTAIVIPVDEQGDPLMRAAQAPGGSLFEAWANLNRQGERPCVITSLDAGNPAKLANRGIVRLERVELVAGHAYNAVSDPAFEHKGE